MSNYNNKNSTEEEIMEVDKNININNFKTKTKENVHKDFKVNIPTNEKNFSTLLSPENLQSTRFKVNFWLRKSGNPTDKQILTLNINADSRINTFDALGIVESFVNGTSFAILSRF